MPDLETAKLKLMLAYNQGRDGNERRYILKVVTLWVSLLILWCATMAGMVYVFSPH